VSSLPGGAPASAAATVGQRLTVSVAVSVRAVVDAVIVTLRFLRVVAVSIGNVALLAPPAIVTLAGTVA